MKGILWLTIPSQSLSVRARYSPARHLHVTLEFNADGERWKNIIGKKVRVQLIEECWNDEIQAVRVKLPAGYQRICKNEHPHITISHLKNVKPVKSNEMLAGAHDKKPLKKGIDTVVEFYEFKEKKEEPKKEKPTTPKTAQPEPENVRTPKEELEPRLGQKIVKRLSKEKARILWAHYTALSQKEKEEIDEKISKGESNELLEIAQGMLGIKPKVPKIGAQTIATTGKKITEKKKKISSSSILPTQPRGSSRTTRIPPRALLPPGGGTGGGGGGNGGIGGNSDDDGERIGRGPQRNNIIQEIQRTLLEIIEILRNQGVSERNRQDRERRYFEIELRRRRERRLESRSDGTISSSFEKMVSPIKPLIKRIFEFLIGLVLGRTVIKLIEWFSNKENMKKVDSVFRFLKDNWPKLLSLYILFGTGIGKFARGLIGLVIHGTRRLIAAAAELMGMAGLKSLGKFGKFLGGPRGRLIGTALGVGATVAGGIFINKQIESFKGIGGDGDKKKQAPGVPTQKFAGGGFAKSGGFFSLLNHKSGMVRGTKGVDQIPAMLSDGEFVMSRGAVEKYGVDTLEAMNAAGGGTNQPKIVSMGGIDVPHAAGGGLMGSAPKLSALEIKFANRARQRGITDPIELKAFLAQVNHETGGKFGAPTRELYNTSPNDPPGKPGYEYFKGYVGQIGNRTADDAYNYMGRGYLQITGRANYDDIGKKIGKDLLKNPKLLLTNSDVALDASIEYWKSRVRPKIRNWSNVFDVSREINNPSAKSPNDIMNMGDRTEKFKRYDSIPNDQFLKLLEPTKPIGRKKIQKSFVETLRELFQNIIPKTESKDLRASISGANSSSIDAYDIVKPQSVNAISPSTRYNIPQASRPRVNVIQIGPDGSRVPRIPTAPIGVPNVPAINPFPANSQNSRNAAVYGVG